MTTYIVVIYSVYSMVYSLQFMMVFSETVYSSCRPLALSHSIDAIFLIDSTMNVGGPGNHRAELEFVADFVERMRLFELGNGNRFVLAQFTPELRIELSFMDADNLMLQVQSTKIGPEILRDQLRRRIMNVLYLPCAHLLCSAISVNSALQKIFEGSDQNNAYRPTLIFIFGTFRYTPNGIRNGEIIIRPRAPIHVFVITIGGGEDKNSLKPFSFAATTTHLSVKEFLTLPEFVNPLCQSVHSLLANSQVGHDASSPNNSTSTCLLCLWVTNLCSAILIAILCYGLFHFRKYAHQYKQMMIEEQEKLKKLDEFYRKRELDELDRTTTSQLPADHPAVQLPPVDVLLLVDASNSISNTMFDQAKQFLCKFVEHIDIAPGRSRIAGVLFANEPNVQFDFDRFYSAKAVKNAIQHMPYLGGGTRLAKALTFGAGMLARDRRRGQQATDEQPSSSQNIFRIPQHNRPRVLVLVSDGASDDSFDQQITHLHDRLHIKIAAVTTKNFYKERLKAVTRYDGAVFTLNELESLNIWLWNQQQLWQENFDTFTERQTTFLSDRKHDDHVEIGDDKKYQGGKITSK